MTNKQKRALNYYYHFYFSLENIDAMINTGLFINDLAMHDSSRDLVLAGTQQSAELKLALDQVTKTMILTYVYYSCFVFFPKERLKTKALEESMKRLDIEMKKTDLLLYQMIPKKVADRLRNGERTANLCEVSMFIKLIFFFR